MWKVRISDRAAKCVECKCVIRAFDPRVDWDDESEAESDTRSKVDWRHARYCLDCGLKAMEKAERNVSQCLERARRVHNLTAQRFNRDKMIKVDKHYKTKSVKCQVPSCSGLTHLIISIRGQKLFICDRDHLYIEGKPNGK